MNNSNLKNYDELRKLNPERNIDDTDGWEIVNDFEVLFWKTPCKHAYDVVKVKDLGFRAKLPLVLFVTAQCDIVSTVCVNCFLDSKI